MNQKGVPDQMDLVLLDALQDDIPLTARPWEALGTLLGISEGEVVARLGHLRDDGILRGISPVLEYQRLGVRAATLVAIRLPPDRVQEAAAVVSRCPEVSHNFQRDHACNLWFTLAAENEERLREVLSGILGTIGVSGDDVLELPTIRKFKIDVRFPIIRKGTTEDACGSD